MVEPNATTVNKIVFLDYTLCSLNWLFKTMVCYKKDKFSKNCLVIMVCCGISESNSLLIVLSGHMESTSLVRYCSVMHWSLFRRINSGLTSRLEWILNTPLGLVRRRGSWTPPSPETGSHFFGSDQRFHRVPQCDRGPAHFTMKRKYPNIHYFIF